MVPAAALKPSYAGPAFDTLLFNAVIHKIKVIQISSSFIFIFYLS